VNGTALAAQRRSLTRGGVLDAPDLCAAYFECYQGYYLATRADTGALECLPCEYPEASSGSRVFLSRGLTFGDKFSCLYGSLRPRLNNNSVGEYGVPLRSCPPSKTSEPGMALAEADCVSCPRQPAYGYFRPETFDCRPACAGGYAARGEACVLSDPAALDCDSDGYADTESGCEPSPLPWSAIGWQGAAQVSVSVQAHSSPLVALDELGDFRVLRDTGALARQGVADFCAGLRAVLENKGYVQDKPLFTQACGDVESHRIYLLASGEKYLYVFLERSFGNNNRFVMWQMQKAATATTPRVGNPGQVWQTFRMPAKACSAVVVPEGAGDVVYVALCGSTFVSYAAQLDYMQAQPVPDADGMPFVLGQTQYVLGRRLGVLIGQEDAGNRDGMRSQALFRGPLALATTADAHRILVADTGNCRIAEVIVDRPGSFLTRATTVAEAACFSGDFPLPYPRIIASVLGGAAALFVTDAGLVQLDAKMRRFSTIFSSSELRQAIGEPLWIRAEQGGERLVLANQTHAAVITRVQGQCPEGHRSRRGGLCSACATGTYSTGAACVPCTARQCGENFRLISCTLTADSRCEACVGGGGFPFRYGQDCQIIPKYPCPAGYYGLDDCLPCSAASFRKWPPHAFCQCLGLSLGPNRTCAVANPWPNVPDWLVEQKCDYDLDENCSATACYLASVQPRACIPCPRGTFTSNSLHCSACPGFRTPSPARDACVCTAPSAASADGSSCVCPPGHAAGGAVACEPCAAGTVKQTATVLLDEAAPSDGSCSFCPPGQEPSRDATACIPCRPGLYREGAMTSCARCPVGVAYAADPTSQASCSQCTKQCQQGQRWDPCPVNASYFTCAPCPRMARFRELVPEGQNCEWRCVTGFYERNGNCFPCTNVPCEHGFKITPCSAYEDAHCRVPCQDETKPEENSMWINDCYWDCKPGYAKTLKEYPGWLEYACVEADEYVPWSIGV
jgi:hypothetical protein